ncbi:hypothetical protein BJ742DRAFT_906689 [Cladochytrium replicatum]|nr:hypothetical protein BJ742DRAFT_906689 [Cladochytrium replicatum]
MPPNFRAGLGALKFVSSAVDPDSLDDALGILVDMCGDGRITDDNLCEAIEDAVKLPPATHRRPIESNKGRIQSVLFSAIQVNSLETSRESRLEANVLALLTVCLTLICATHLSPLIALFGILALCTTMVLIPRRYFLPLVYIHARVHGHPSCEKKDLGTKLIKSDIQLSIARPTLENLEVMSPMPAEELAAKGRLAARVQPAPIIIATFSGIEARLDYIIYTEKGDHKIGVMWINCYASHVRLDGVDQLYLLDTNSPTVHFLVRIPHGTISKAKKHEKITPGDDRSSAGYCILHNDGIGVSILRERRIVLAPGNSPLSLPLGDRRLVSRSVHPAPQKKTYLVDRGLWVMGFKFVKTLLVDDDVVVVGPPEPEGMAKLPTILA